MTVGTQLICGPFGCSHWLIYLIHHIDSSVGRSTGLFVDIRRLKEALVLGLRTIELQRKGVVLTE